MGKTQIQQVELPHRTKMTKTQNTKIQKLWMYSHSFSEKQKHFFFTSSKQQFGWEGKAWND